MSTAPRCLLILLGLLAVNAPVQAQKCTPWQMHVGEIVEFKKPLEDKGWPTQFKAAQVPLADDPGWADAPDPKTIGYLAPGLGPKHDWKKLGKFTYFQCALLPKEDMDYSLLLKGVDTCVQIRVLHDLAPREFPTVRQNMGSMKAKGEETIDLNPFVRIGCINRVVLIHADNGADQATLKYAKLQAKPRRSSGGWKDLEVIPWEVWLVQTIKVCRTVQPAASSWKEKKIAFSTTEDKKTKTESGPNREYLIALQRWQMQMAQYQMRQQMIQYYYSRMYSVPTTSTTYTYRVVYYYD